MKYLCKRFSQLPFIALAIKAFHVSIIVFLFAFNASHALDPIYDYRYTMGPEILVPDAFFVSGGFYSRWNADGMLVLNMQLGLTDNIEIGAKFLGGTNDNWVISDKNRGNRDIIPVLDVGAKFAISPHLSLQADIPIALNNEKDWGAIVSISQWDGYTKNVSFLFEGRLAFLGSAGEDGYVKPSLAYFPHFQIGESFRLSVGPVASFSWGNIKDDLMLDILPRLEVGFAMFRLIGEASIGILTWEARKYNRFAGFVQADI